MKARNIKKFLKGNMSISIYGYVVKYKNNNLIIKNSDDVNVYGIIQDKLNVLMYNKYKKEQSCSISYWKKRNNSLTRKEISDIIKEKREVDILCLKTTSKI